MSPALPVVSGSQVIRALESVGYAAVRRRGCALPIAVYRLTGNEGQNTESISGTPVEAYHRTTMAIGVVRPHEQAIVRLRHAEDPPGCQKLAVLSVSIANHTFGVRNDRIGVRLNRKE